MLPGRPTVLIVDRDDDTRGNFTDWLTQAGYSCVAVDDSLTALWYARNLAPIAAIVDMARQQEGLRLASKLGHESPTTAVLLTSSPRRSHDLPALPDGVCGHVLKPSAPGEIVEAVTRAATIAEARRRLAHDEHDALRQAMAKRQQQVGRVIADVPTAELAHSRLRHLFGSRVPPIFAHARRVARTSEQLARALMLPNGMIQAIVGAALLHDVGKLALHERVLRGEQPFGDPEAAALGDHQQRTLDLLSRAPALRPVARIVEYSEASWDGTGVPWGVGGQDIPIGSRILAAADAADAWHGEGDPGSARVAARCTSLMRQAGTRLDPDLVRVCLCVLDPADDLPQHSSRQRLAVRCS